MSSLTYMHGTILQLHKSFYRTRIAISFPRTKFAQRCLCIQLQQWSVEYTEIAVGNEETAAACAGLSFGGPHQTASVFHLTFGRAVPTYFAVVISLFL